jgi:uncharacterized protein
MNLLLQSDLRIIISELYSGLDQGRNIYNSLRNFMRILISGASGLVGTSLKNYLKAKGHDVFTLVRDRAKLDQNSIYWEPQEGKIDLQSMENFDAVVNLAGTNIADTRWTKKRKNDILQSRLQAAKTLVNALEKLDHPPKTFVSISAIGFYGDSGLRVCTEDTPNGKGFLADVCRQWEQASQVPAATKIRTVHLRLGVVLSTKGGALSKMLIPFKLGLGGPLGSGEQYMSWITIEDVVEIILFALTNHSLVGPINAVAPNPATNSEFTKALGKVLNRPTFFRVPAFMLQLILGKEMADEILLASTCVKPVLLEKAGYQFLYPDLDKALKALKEQNGK